MKIETLSQLNELVQLRNCFIQLQNSSGRNTKDLSRKAGSLIPLIEKHLIEGAERLLTEKQNWVGDEKQMEGLPDGVQIKKLRTDDPEFLASVQKTKEERAAKKKKVNFVGDEPEKRTLASIKKTQEEDGGE